MMNLAGQHFGKLAVIAEAQRRGEFRYWQCRCTCGAIREVKQSALRNGNTKSCGCGKRSRIITASTSHGMSGTREHYTWLRMKGRCGNPSNGDFARYGGRGITVCRRWRESFEAFLSDMGPQPPNTSIDRIDNDGNYEPGNCRWATQKQQCRNKANNRVLTHGGVSLCMTEWAERIGVKFGTLQSRIEDYGWPIERALTTPVK